MKQLKQLSEKFGEQIKKNETEANQLQENIKNLWERLNIEIAERDDFMNSLPTSTLSKIEILKEEEARLVIIKQENIDKYIAKIKSELESWWECCYTSQQEKDSFSPFLSDEANDDVLNALEKQLEKLKLYYSENEHLFQKLEERQQLWKEVMELEESANNPNRLFENRKGGLLLEEKKRKQLKKKLPQVEQELEKMEKNFEKENNFKFLIKGVTVSEYIQEQWELYNSQKEQEKKERQETKKKILEIESKLGSTSMKKRTLSRNDTLRVSKYLKTNESVRSNTTTSSNFISPMSRRTSRPKRPQLMSPGLTPVREARQSRFSPHRSVLKERNMNSPFKKHEKKSQGVSASDVSSYSSFSVSNHLTLKTYFLLNL